jgi:hypothetical protein
MGLGGRFAFQDAGQSPNTQLTLVELPGLPLLIENRNLPQKLGVKAMDQFRGIREGIALDCEGGSFVGLRGGGWIYDRAGQRLRQFPGDGGGKHLANFLDAVRSRRTADLHAPLREGHVSSAVCHLGNLSWRLGQPASEGACRAALGQHPGAVETLELLERHVAANGVNLAQSRFVLGPWLEVDPRSEEITRVAAGDSALLTRARQMAAGSQRAPYGFGG